MVKEERTPTDRYINEIQAVSAAASGVESPIGTIKTPVKRQVEIICRGTEQVLPIQDLEMKLSLGRQLTVKFGCDPSRPDLHLGHAVVLRKLREIQDLGHKVILIVGDFTAMIGDPTGKSKTRPALSLEETRRNGETYVQQATRILDPDPAKLTIVHNSQWLNGLGFQEVIRLASTYTVARMLERDDFKKRFHGQVSISVHEFLYPLVQAYDSVALKADIEVGGTDQTFNLLVGRDIQPQYAQDQQVILTMPILTGLDGKDKMSKSLDNYIGITEAPELMYTKLMRVPDHLLCSYLALLTYLPVLETMRLGAVEAHRKLAEAVITSLHGPDAAEAGRQRYNSVAQGGSPALMPELVVDSSALDPDGGVKVTKLALIAGVARSFSEARRLIEGRGIRISGTLVTDVNASIAILDDGVVFQKGKDYFCRFIRSEK